MAHVLFVHANPKPRNQSHTLRLADAFIEAYLKNNPSDEIVELDLYHSEIPIIDERVLRIWHKFSKKIELDNDEIRLNRRMNEIFDQFAGAEKIILAAPMWNHSFPSVVKAYVDNVVVMGKSFKYSEKGPVGLLKDRPLLFVQSRGGVYSSGPMQAFEDAESYLRNIFSFVGIQNFQVLLCEGVNSNPNGAESIFQNAVKRAQEIANNF